MQNNSMMEGFGWMMGGTAIVGALFLVVLVLALFALIKYLRS